MAELLDIRFPHELDGARKELVARDLIAYEGGIYQVLVLELPVPSLRKVWRFFFTPRPGVGPITGLDYVLVMGTPDRVPCGKQIGSYIGLIP